MPWIDRPDELARNAAAHRGVDKLITAARLERLKLDHQWPYWPRPPDWRIASFGLDLFGDGLAVRDLRIAHIGLDLELAQQAIDDDIQMQFAHAGDDGLPRLVIRKRAERRILFGQLPSAMLIFSWPALVLGSMATWMTGSGNTMDSSTIGSFSTHSVSPVVVSRRPTMAAMSPA